MTYSKYRNYRVAKHFLRLNRTKELEKKTALTLIEKQTIIANFEKQTGELALNTCNCCKTSRLDNEIKGPQKRCQRCRRYKYTLDFLLGKKALPVWRKNGIPMYHVPAVLAKLSHAEKALIQRLSPFVPLTHIKKGTMGLSGHTCVFEQDLNGFVNTLPRKLDDITLMNVVKKIRLEIGSNSTIDQIFKVNKKKVFNALTFLKKYNPEYKDINIDMTNLDWMNENNDILNIAINNANKSIFSNESIDKSKHNDDYNNNIDDNSHDNNEIIDDDIIDDDDDIIEAIDDIGPCPIQAHDPNEKNKENISNFGYINEQSTPFLSKDDRTINNKLQDQLNSCKNKPIFHWPTINNIPVNEYSDKRIFAMSFPWLFPGGEGDVIDYPGDITEWGRNMLFYEDGRFDKDDFFSFFAMNYITRHRNSKSGGFFVKAFSKGCPGSLEELQQQIRKGNLSFINSLTYYNKRVKGSNSYWRSKRAELYTWINYHVEHGNGVPMFFITLSCAEYYWHDIIRLLKQKLELAGENSSDCYVGSKKMTNILNQYTSVIQEYFQNKVKIWLNTVGKSIFGIKHYWVRYEFAPGRGQIHAHLLAISEDQAIYQLCHEDLKQIDGQQKRAQRLANFVQQHYDMTATISTGYDEITVEEGRQSLKMQFTEIKDHDTDVQRLSKVVLDHKCSGFCMRTHENRYEHKMFGFDWF